MADFVIVAQHNSTSEGSRGENPSDFVVDFARKAIDAGADIYFGHGWHTFLGIEIYKGKPIIYGMGNFFMEEVFLSRIPADSYESYGVDMDKLTSVNPAIGNLHPGTDQEDWCWTAVYEFKFVDKKVSEIRLHPVDMGMDFSSGKGVMNRYRRVAGRTSTSKASRTWPPARTARRSSSGCSSVASCAARRWTSRTASESSRSDTRSAAARRMGDSEPHAGTC